MLVVVLGRSNITITDKVSQPVETLVENKDESELGMEKGSTV